MGSRKPYICDQLIVDQDAKTIQWGKELCFQQKVLGRLDSQEDPGREEAKEMCIVSPLSGSPPTDTAEEGVCRGLQNFLCVW